jgi:hypothetical protein
MSGGRFEEANTGPHKATPLADSVLFDRKELSPHCPERSTFTPIPIAATSIGLPRPATVPAPSHVGGTTDFIGDW